MSKPKPGDHKPQAPKAADQGKPAKNGKVAGSKKAPVAEPVQPSKPPGVAGVQPTAAEPAPPKRPA